MLIKAAAVMLIALSTTSTPRMKPVESLLSRETRCLTEAVYYEAPNETREGKLAVATVVMNRMKSREFPHSVCGVVYQRSPRGCQFSWVCGNKPDHGKTAYNESLAIAREVMNNGTRLAEIGNATYFHNTSVVPSWSKTFTLVQQIGNHLFYVAERNSD